MKSTENRWELMFEYARREFSPPQENQPAPEQTILDFINNYQLPETLMRKFGYRAEEIQAVMESMLEKTGDSNEIAAIIKEILTRTTPKFYEISRWAVQQPLPFQENTRRAKILKKFNFRRLVLIRGYEKITGEKWSTQKASAVAVLEQIDTASKDAEEMDFDSDYTDLLF